MPSNGFVGCTLGCLAGGAFEPNAAMLCLLSCYIAEGRGGGGSNDVADDVDPDDATGTEPGATERDSLGATTPHLADDVLRFVRAVGPQPDEVLAEMDAYAEREGFPHVGPEVGGFLELTARIADARSVFEFGSGYGYSAYWFARALPENGEIVLTEIDEKELDMAREYLERGGHDDLASYELGDALDTVERYDGPFDVVLIDHQKERYVEAFEAVRGKLAPGAVVIADNALSAEDVVVFEDLLAHVEGRPVETNEGTRGIAAYLDRVRADPDFETMVLPLGEGIAVSCFEG